MNKSLGKVKYLYVFLLVLSLLMYLVAPVFPNKVRADNEPLVSLSHTSEIDRLIELCIRTIKGEINFTRPLVEKYIDLVIVQDASGSFENTIGTMKDGLKEVVDKLDSGRGDRVMVTTFRGGQYHQWYEIDSNGDQVKKDIGSNNGRYLTVGDSFIEVDTKTPYALGNDFIQAKNKIGDISVDGGTPTARGIQYALNEYNSKRTALGDAGDLLRETVFLLVTDGVANVRLPDGSAGDKGTMWLDWNWTYAPDGQSHPTGTGNNAAVGFNEKYQDYKTATNQASAQATVIKNQGYYLISAYIEDFQKQKDQYGGGSYYGSVVGPYTKTALESMATSAAYYVEFDTPANFGTTVGNLLDALVAEISQESIEVVIEPGYQVLSSRLLKNGVVINANLGLVSGTNIVEVEQEGNYTIEYELKELDFYGTDKTPVTATGRSGQKRYNINNPVIPGNTNTVCTLEPTVPIKRVNGVEHYDLSQVREEVTYTVTTHVDNIFGMTSFGFEDQVDALLKITAGSADVKADGVSIVKPGELTVISNKITFSKTSDFNQIKGKDVVLEFKASIDACVICGEVKSVYPDGKIPNTAQLVYNGQKTSSNTVTIAPPAPVVPQISKDVNGKSHENLVAADDSFDYHVKVLLPQLAVGERYQSLVIEDTLEAVLEIQDTAVLIDGVAVPALDAFVSIAGQKVTLTLVEADFDFDDIIGKVIALEITAVIRPGADLSIYEGELVPNDGDYSINGNQKVKSNRVTVTPPPDEPDIDKDVNGKSHEDLGSKDELFTYHVLIDIPESVRGYESIVVSDTLESVLEIVSSKVRVGTDEDLLAPYLTVSGQTATLVLDNEFDFSQIAGEQIVIELVARIRTGANLDAYPNDTVPNRAGISFNDQPEVKTDYVTVTPPAGTPVIEKDVNGKEHEDLALFSEVFTYHVDMEIPNNTRDYASLVISDTLEDVLEIIDAQVLLDGDDESNLTPFLVVSGQTVSLSLDETYDYSLLSKKTIRLVIQARIRAGADLSAYERETVPNVASYLINDQIDGDSNIVTVTPPLENPTIEKDVNGKTHEDLAARYETFIYHVFVDLPDYTGRYDSLVISDTLEDVLERGGVQVLVDGLPDAGLTARLVFDGQTIRLTLGQTDLGPLAGKQIQLQIEASIRDGADLSAYTDDTVPNQASVRLNHDPQIMSNRVTVTPPPEEVTIVKDVNGKTHEDLDSKGELFVYHVEVEIPGNVRGYESLVIRDTLEDVLRVMGAGILLDGVENEDLTNRISKLGQTLSLTLGEEDFAGLAGKTITLAILARIREGADLTGYEGSTVPNQGSVQLNDSPEQMSNIVTVTPPPEEPDIVKTVDGKEHLDLEEKDQVFNYQVMVEIPYDVHGYESLVIRDTLEDVLQAVDARILLDGVEDAALTARISELGQTLSLTLGEDDFAGLAGRTVTLSILARIREGAALTGYEGSTVPNQGSVQLNDNPEIQSNVVTVTPPIEEPDIVKTVDGKEHLDLEEKDQVFNYRVEVEIPYDVHGYESLVIRDTLEDVLQATGARILLDGVEDAALTARISELGQTLSLALGEDDFAGLAGRTVTLSILARIREGADLTGYEGSTVPNQGAMELNDGPGIESNVVTVTPPPEQPDIVKVVDGKLNLALEEKDQVFSYQVGVEIPRDVHGYESLVLYDRLEDVLEILGVRVLVDGLEVADLTRKIVVDGQEVRLVLDDSDDFAFLAGKMLNLEIDARIREDADLDAYPDEMVPNTARLRLNEEAEIESNRVMVKPPEELVAGDTDELPKTGGFIDKNLLLTLGLLLMAAGALVLIRLKDKGIQDE